MLPVKSTLAKTLPWGTLKMSEPFIKIYSSKNRIMVFMTVLFVAMLATILIAAPAAYAYDNEELAFLTLINNHRQANGRGPLTLSTSLYNASEDHSYDMGARNYFSHNTPEGVTPWDRIRAAGYTYNTWLGENIAAGYGTAQTVYNAWLNSPGHNDNMLGANFRAIGIGRVYVGGSTYGWYWTTDFGGVSEDSTPPSVSVPQPTGSSKVSGVVAFTANAWDNVGVTKVDLYIDGSLVSSDSSAPYSYNWDTTGLQGSHALRAVAWDSAELTAEASTVVTVDNFTPTKRYYFTWYDQYSPGTYDWVLMVNPAGRPGAARTSVKIGQLTYADRDLAVGAPAESPMFPGVVGGPVTVSTTQPIVVSQRILWGGKSLEEVMGIDEARLSDHYYWPWYDQKTRGTLDWVLVANPNADPIYYEIKIAGVLRDSGTINANEKVTPSFNGIGGGPVEVQAWTQRGGSAAKVISSQRVLMGNGAAFNEVPGIPAAELSSNYEWTWYDNVDGMNWVLIANPDTATETIRAEIWIGGRQMKDPDNPGRDYFILTPGQMVTPRFASTKGGPVEVRSYVNGGSWQNVNDHRQVLASQRILWGPSFEEVPGYPVERLNSSYYWSWYDQRSPGSLNWVLVANQNNYEVDYSIEVGGTVYQKGKLAAGAKVTPSFGGVMGGSVKVEAWTSGTLTPAPVMASQRVLWNGYFNEALGTVLD